MSPISTQLPAVALEWEQEWTWPGIFGVNPDSRPGATAGGFFERILQRTPTSWSNAPGPVFGGPVAGYGGAGTTPTLVYATVQGRACLTMSRAVAAFFGSGWRPPDYVPMLGAPAGMAPGATMIPGAVVGVFDWNMIPTLAGATPTWGNDSTGIAFMPVGGIYDQIPGGPAVAKVGGFGVFLNNDGAGGSRWEYVSWASGNPAPILERVPITGINLGEWNTFRTVIVGGDASREAAIVVSVNGATIAARDFGSAELQRPGTAFVNATGLSSGLCYQNGPDSVSFAMAARFGRFTPDGTEVQGE